MIDAEGSHAGERCPECGSTHTVTYTYREGFSELECPECGYRSDAEELSSLQNFGGTLLQGERDVPPLPRKALKA